MLAACSICRRRPLPPPPFSETITVFTHGFRVGEIVAHGLSGLRIRGEGEKLTVRLLDLESCEVVTRRYRWVRSERLTVNGVAASYRVIEFWDRHRWVLPGTE